MDALTEHWQSLYAVDGSSGLRERAASVEALLQQVQREGVGTRVAASPPAPDTHSSPDPADISRAILGDELKAAVRKLKYGRAIGSDGLRGICLRVCLPGDFSGLSTSRCGLRSICMTLPLGPCWVVCLSC
jgi:hypothetical protein